MTSDNTFKNILMMLLVLFVLGYFIHSFIYGDRKSILIFLSITSIIAAIYSVAENLKILKVSENPEKRYIAKFALTRVMCSLLLLSVLIPTTLYFSHF